MGKARWNRPTDVNNLEASRFVFEETKTKLLRLYGGTNEGIRTPIGMASTTSGYRRCNRTKVDFCSGVCQI